MFMATQWLLRGEHLTWSRTEKSLFFSVLFCICMCSYVDLEFVDGLRYALCHVNLKSKLFSKPKYVSKQVINLQSRMHKLVPSEIESQMNTSAFPSFSYYDGNQG